MEYRWFPGTCPNPWIRSAAKRRIIMTTDYENLQEGIRELELPPIECFRNIYADRLISTRPEPKL